MIKIIRTIGMSALAAGLGLLVTPIARAQDSVFVTTTGDVGIGTSTPAVRLDVKSSAAGQVAARLQNSSATGHSGIHYLDHAGNIDLYFGIDNANSTTRLDSVNNNPILILTNSVERMRITSAGNVTTTGDVGIGISTPTARLDVESNGSNPVTARFRNSNPSADVFNVLLMENANTGVNGSSALQLASNSSFANIQAHGSGRTISRFGQPLASWVEIVVAGASNGVIVGTQFDKPLILGTNNADRLHINPTGDIGIGTTTPASKLHVNGGDIRVSGGSFIDDGVTLNAPDYVFEPSYRLMPLEELREFITQEKHLPNVPNAREVREQGLNLGQSQMRLLEKIEELTLYTLSQHEQIADLHKENSELRERLEALEGALQQQ